MRLIDADAAIDAVHYEYDSCCNIDESGSAIADDIERIIDNVPSAQPELDIWNDGTLHISVSKGQLDKIGRVLVEENGTIFCKLFYQDAESESYQERRKDT